MSPPPDRVFLFDVDNTLLDNDRLRDDMDAHLREAAGTGGAARYWAHFEALREQLGYADYLGALQRLRLDAVDDPRLPVLSAFFLDYPFAERLYPGALAVLQQVRRAGPVVILSDGDAVFQPHKIRRAGLWDAADAVLIHIHKEQMLATIERQHPARHYVLVDDKPRILAAIKRQWGPRVTTVFPRQGHYATDPQAQRDFAPADVAVAHIGDLLQLDPAAFDAAGPFQEVRS